MAGEIKRIRWSVWSAGIEFGVTANKVRAGLAALDIAPGPDGKFSTREIFRALADSSGLKHKAAEARYQRQIDEAQIARDKVLENKRTLVNVSEWIEMFTDLQTVLVQVVRHSKLSDGEKALMLRKIQDAPKELEKGEYKR